MSVKKLPESLGFHVYEGVYYNNTVSATSLDKIKNFELNEDDVVICSFPKSGTTWMVNIIKLIDEDDQDGPKLTCHINDMKYLMLELRTLLHDTQYPVDVIDVVQDIKGPRLFMTHLRPSFFKKALELKRTKFIFIIRNEKDTLVSWYHWHKKHYSFKGDWNKFYDDYRKEELSYGSWIEANSYWLDYKNLDNVLLIKFEDMKENLMREIAKIAKFLGRKMKNIDKICETATFDNLKQTEEKECELFKQTPIFCRKGEVGEWKDYFSKEQSAEIDKIYEDKIMPKGLVMRFSL